MSDTKPAAAPAAKKGGKGLIIIIVAVVVLGGARSAILEVLATQEPAALVTPAGKAELKKAIAEHTTTVLKKEGRDVLFTDFVVQF